MGSAKLELREAAVRLRTESRLSIKEIQEITGASVGSLSLWLKAHPLTPDEIVARHVGHVSHTKKARGDRSSILRDLDLSSFDRSRRARVAEAAILFRLTLHGFHVANPVFDGAKPDFIIESPAGRLLKVQVKCAIEGKQTIPTLSLRCSNGRGKSRRYVDGEFDALIGYDLYTDTAYVYKADDVRGRKWPRPM